MSINLNIFEVFAILLIHWFADFVLQTDDQAKGKSTSNKYLTHHVLVYSVFWLIIAFCYSVITKHRAMYFFPVITFACHWITDYITSREVKKRFDKGDHHNGFVVIGFDQLLHYAQLLLTYQLLKL